jgi:hypothetical protein
MTGATTCLAANRRMPARRSQLKPQRGKIACDHDCCQLVAIAHADKPEGFDSGSLSPAASRSRTLRRSHNPALTCRSISFRTEYGIGAWKR